MGFRPSPQPESTHVKNTALAGRFFRPNEPSESLVSLHLRALTLEPILGWHYDMGNKMVTSRSGIEPIAMK